MGQRRVSKAVYPAVSQEFAVPVPVDGGRYAKLNEEYQGRVKFLPADEQRAWHEANKEG